MTPTTRAGLELMRSFAFPDELFTNHVVLLGIIAIESEASVSGFREGLEHAKATYGPGHAIAERARLRELVEAIPADSTCYCEADRDVTHDEPDGGGPIYVRREAVLALLRGEAS